MGSARRRLIATEHAEQVTLIEWAAMMTPTVPALGLLFAIPNAGAGAQRGQAGKMKAEGVKAGVPDLCLPVARRGYHGLFIELKSTAPGVRLSPAQQGWIAALRSEGYCVDVCYGFDRARERVWWYVQG